MSSIYNNSRNIFGYEKVGEYKNDVSILIGEKSFQFDLNTYRTIFPYIKQNDLKLIKNAGNTVFYG